MLQPTIANEVRAMYETEDGLFILHKEFYGDHRSLGDRTHYVALGWDNRATRDKVVVEFHEGVYLPQADAPRFTQELNAAFAAAAQFNEILSAN